ncbi:hypothetical protein RI129_001257 [Pyrocoelia pectoralis]|uniref:Choline transporter-like protein n=1 Tax=Pyrocoelia pectoralis TaxID=417401 RepID=A0AAN7ZWX0_9COLE
MGCYTSKATPLCDKKGGDRGCTDVFWLIIYILFWTLMILVAAFSFVYGNPLRIVNGYDSFGNICGTKNNEYVGTLELSGRDMTGRPYLLYYDIRELKRCLKICIKECPTRTITTMDDLYNYYLQTHNDICKYDFNYNSLKNINIPDKSGLGTNLGPCPKLPVYESEPILNRCVPKLLGDVTSDLLSEFYDLLNNWGTMEQILGDLYNSWLQILGLVFVSLIMSLVTVALLHLLASVVSYIVMILVSIACIGGTGFLWYTYYDIRVNNASHENKLIPVMAETTKNETTFQWFAYASTIITVVILLQIVYTRKQVDLLSNLFKETSNCLLHIPSLFLQPIITFVFVLALFAFGMVLCLTTAYYPGQSSVNSSVETGPEIKMLPNTNQSDLSKLVGQISLPELNKFTEIQYVDPLWVKCMWWVYFIGLLWTSEFIMACQQMVIAGSVAHWYFRDKYNNRGSHVTYAICKLLKYHLGSVALGSLLITTFKIPRLILTYLHTKLQASKDKGSECAKCGLKCCICCFYCLEKFIKYINHNAYTVIAIDGSNFCSAAATAFQVLTSHIIQVATINGIGDFILSLGKVFVTAFTGSLGLFFFRNNPNLSFYAAPTIIVCIFSFIVAHCILSLYEMVLDTIYFCTCQNAEDASEEMPLENLTSKNKGTHMSQEFENIPIK